jgi:hypothetical protein
MSAICPVSGSYRPFVCRRGRPHKCHVWTAPSWQGESSRSRGWSVQPCVRPVSAVRMTAGHNALRGSGPGRKLAFAAGSAGCEEIPGECGNPGQADPRNQKISSGHHISPRARLVLSLLPPPAGHGQPPPSRQLACANLWPIWPFSERPPILATLRRPASGRLRGALPAARASGLRFPRPGSS